MKIFRTAIIFGIAMLLTSCTRYLPPLISFAHFSSPVANSFQLATNNAVVFGRFTIGPDFAFGNDLALRLCSEDSKRVYLIQFHKKDSVRAISVKPGRYRVAGYLATYIDHRPIGYIDTPVTGVFEVKSNAATYLGDFTGYAKISATTQEWGSKGMTNNLSATKHEFQLQYTNLSTVTVLSAPDQLNP